MPRLYCGADKLWGTEADQFQNFLGMSVVGSDFDKLKRYNLAELRDPSGDRKLEGAKKKGGDKQRETSQEGRSKATENSNDQEVSKAEEHSKSKDEEYSKSNNLSQVEDKQGMRILDGE
jgi:tRNA acetyltransferase TAN1